MHRNADGAGLVGDRARDGLANPPRGVRGELVAAAPLEFVDGFHQADVAFLNQVEELQSAVRVLLRDRYDQAKVRFDQFFLRLFGFRFAANDHLNRALQLRGAYFAGDFDFVEFLAARLQVLARFGLNVGLRRFHAPVELHDLAFEVVHALDRLANLVDQALLFERVVIEVADEVRHLHARARQIVTSVNVRTLLRARNFFELLRLLHRQQVELGDAVDLLERFLGLLLDFLFGQLFIVELNDFLDRAGAVAQVFADLQNFLQNQRSPRNRLQAPAIARARCVSRWPLRLRG